MAKTTYTLKTIIMSEPVFTFEEGQKRGHGRMSIKQFLDDYIYAIDIDADYQRDRVWSTQDQQLLLDSIVTGIDVPKIYLATAPESDQFMYECIDGKQRIVTLLNFFKPEEQSLQLKKPLTVEVAGDKYTYKQLLDDMPTIAKRMEDFKLDFTLYRKEDLEEHEDFIRKIFKRLQLGVRLNSGELLKAHQGAMRDFVYETIGSHGPFVGRTKLSDKRYARQLTVAQICLNSFKYHKTGDYSRARLKDMEDFFEDNYSLSEKDENFVRVYDVLKLMDEKFGEDAQKISSRAVAVSAYLFVEKLHKAGKDDMVSKFAEFYVKLLDEIKKNSKLLTQFKEPENLYIMENFQKYISQASAESYSLRRRDDFLESAFKFYIESDSKKEIINNTER